MPEDLQFEGGADPVENILREIEKILALLLAEESRERLRPQLHRSVWALLGPVKRVIRFLREKGSRPELVKFAQILVRRLLLAREVRRAGTTLELIEDFKAEMARQGVTQAELARRLGCTIENVAQHLAKHKTKTMLIVTAERLAAALGLRLEMTLAPGTGAHRSE